MVIRVKVTPGTRLQSIEVGIDGRYLVDICAPRKEGRANEELCGMLARYFHVPRKNVIIVHGKDQSSKRVRIEGGE